MKTAKGKMIRLALFAISLALLLLVAATGGSVWHHHANPASESTCAFCHLAHQAAQQAIVVQCSPTIAVVGDSVVFAEPALVFLFVNSGLSTRAPPSL